MKNWIVVLILVAILIVVGGNFYLKKECEEEKSELLNEIHRLWGSKIADNQFLINTTYRIHSGWLKNYLDSLDRSQDILREVLTENELTKANKDYLEEFIWVRFLKVTQSNRDEILKRLQIESENELFVGTNLEIVKRLLKVINPYSMSTRKKMLDFDIWEDSDKRNLNVEDTIKLKIRLLPNYDMKSHYMELVESENLKVIKPYLGELTVLNSKRSKDREKREVSFQIYDWINQDTITINTTRY